MNNDILKEMENRMGSFSRGQRQIANFIHDNYDKAAYMTAAKLGSVVRVSESTVVRFANEMGFDGYPEFQLALRELIRNRLTSFQRIEVTNSLIGDGDVLDKVLEADADNIRRTMEEIDREAFDRAIDKIAGAKTIYIIGVRSSATLAGFLNYSLRMMFDNVKLVQTTSGSELFEQIMQIGPQDVMIAVSFPRYSKRIVNAVTFARNAGAEVVALTSGTMSPIAPYATELLLARSDMASFADSLVAPMSILNAMVVALSRKNQELVTERLRKLEKIWDEYDVYDKSQG